MHRICPCGKKQIEMLNRNKEAILTYLDCSAIVVKSKWVKALLKIVFAMYKLTRPNKVLKSLDNAKQWVAANTRE